jgi:hypothetical protein
MGERGLLVSFRIVKGRVHYGHVKQSLGHATAHILYVIFAEGRQLRSNFEA